MVRDAFEAAVSAPVGDPAVPSVGAIILKRAADVVSEPIDWLWRHYLARGKLHLLGGAPSAGKTTLACWFAAVVSKAGSFPGGPKAPGGTVLIWSGEDAIADTLKPRLEAAGANLDRIHFIDGVTEQDGPRAFDPARDIANLERAVQQLGDVALLILDPVVSAVAGDGHKSNDVRRALQPIVDMVGRHGVAALGITHFSKGTSGRDPTERITGSVAFGALARVVLVAAKETQDNGETASPADMRIFTRAKSNIGPDGGGFRYAVEQVDLPGGITTTKVVWGEPLSGSARELLGQAESDTEQGGGSGAALDEAVNFLLFELADGAVPVKELERSAADAGIAKATLRRAYEKAGVKKERSGFGKGGSWIAFIPGSEPIDAHENPKVLTPESVSTYGKSEHLWTGETEIEL
jgi:putative DNA primase/helicase